MRIKLLSLSILFLSINSLVKAQDQKLEVIKITGGVFAMIYSEPRFDPVESNSIVVIGQEYVLVVDAHRSPAAACSRVTEENLRENFPDGRRLRVNQRDF